MNLSAVMSINDVVNVPQIHESLTAARSWRAGMVPLTWVKAPSPAGRTGSRTENWLVRYKAPHKPLSGRGDEAAPLKTSLYTH